MLSLSSSESGKSGLSIPLGSKINGQEIAAFITWDKVELIDPEIDIVALCLNHAKALSEYSCGQCIPCRVGTKALVSLFRGLKGSKNKEKDIDAILSLSETISQASLCEIGRSTVVYSTLCNAHRSRFKGASNTSKKKDKFAFRSFYTAPCMEACPIHLDIPRYVEAVKNGQYQEGLNVITQRLPLPGVLGRVCVRPCEFNCRRTLIDEPIQIRHLKRFLADKAKVSNGNCDFIKEFPKNYQQPIKKRPNGIKTAVIGAGPSGLTCAYFLALMGYDVTIFERLSEPGGMAAVGIPDYRLPRDILRYEVKAIEALGVRIVYGKSLGRDFTVEGLQEQGFKATFIAVGCHSYRKIGLEGEDAGYEGLIPGVYFLRNINLGLLEQIRKGKKVAVVGGGNVAIDCVRTALRIGFKEASLIYRRSMQEMPADFMEVRDARMEGVKFYFLAAPKRLIIEDGRIKGLECLWMQLGEPDSSGRKRPIEVPNSEFFVEADVIVPAIGQEIDQECMRGLSGIEISRKGTIVVSEHLMTTKNGVFSGGDCVTGPDVLIRACAQGRKAALRIDQYLRDGTLSINEEEFREEVFRTFKPFDPKETIHYVYQKKRVSVSHEPPLERVSDFREVDKGFTEEEAVREAGRCLRCYRVVTVAVKRSQ